MNSNHWFHKTMRVLFGERPRMVFWFLVPTLVAVAIDLTVRARLMVAYSWLDRLNYIGSSFASAGFWVGPIWLTSRLFVVREGRARLPARIALALFYAFWVFPFAFFCFGGQLIYHRVFGSYMARDTVRLGIKLRGTLGDWLVAWGGTTAALWMIVPGVLITLAIAVAARKAAPSVSRAWPIVPVLTFVASSTAFWNDFVESRSLQAAPPDTCFVHGVAHALRDAITGKGFVRRGISLRTPDPLPPLPIAANRPNVLLVITESVRAEALCSDPNRCQATFLDAVAPDRIPLGRLTSQSSGTFTSCMMLWTGLSPAADFVTAHRAALLWEIARSVGYGTAYVTSQNLRYDDFGAFTQVGGIDVRVSASELGAVIDAQIGAPDERATARMLEYVKSVPEGKPYFAVLHFSNTHAPYRVEPSLQPFSPHSSDPLGDINLFYNHYRNSVALQERTFANFLQELRALPSFADTVVIFVSDHGEQFGEHGGLYHLSALFDEQVRTPGFLVAGERALSRRQRTFLGLFGNRRSFSQDVTATILDLFGVYEARPTLPFASLLTGRSLVRGVETTEPIFLMSTASGVWEPNEPQYGGMQGDRLIVGGEAWPYHCYDTLRDPTQSTWTDPADCGAVLFATVKTAFAAMGVPAK